MQQRQWQTRHAADEAATDDAATDETTTDDAATDEAATDETATDEAAADETATDETTTDETATDEAATDAEEIAVVAPAAVAEAQAEQSSNDGDGLPWWLWLLLALLVFGLLYWFLARRKAPEAPAQPDVTLPTDSVEAAVPAVRTEPVEPKVDADTATQIDTATDEMDAAPDIVVVEQTDLAEADRATVAPAAITASEVPSVDESSVASGVVEEAVADERAVDETDGVEASAAHPSTSDSAVAATVTDELTDADIDDAAPPPAAKVTGIAAAAGTASPAKPAAPDEPSDPDVWDADNHPDDLTQILGIGRVYEKRLYAAGIATWDQVAATSVDELEQATQAVAGANAAGWPSQAQELAAANDRVGARYAGPTPQQLSLIPGIGEQTEQTLYKQGITTYARLATLTPAQLAELLPEADSEADYRAGLP